MGVEYPPRGPRDWWNDWLARARALLERGRAAVDEFLSTARTDVRPLANRTREARRSVTSLGRRLRAGGERAWRRTRRASARVGAALVAGARRIGRAMGPAPGRAFRVLRRRAPDRRIVGLAATAALLLSWVVWERCGLAGCPDVGDLTSYQPGGASVLLDRDGEHFADLTPVEHQIVPLDSLPPFVPEAFVAVEDRRFYDHRGVDWQRVVGALWADIVAGGLVEGSSTIPMQLSRNLFPERIRAQEKTFRRKLLEARMAGEIEDHFSKREILELYLNHIYFGGGARGIEAAARYYFDKKAADLELHEAALLAALPKAPANYDPRRAPERARERRDLVLALMRRQGRVDSAGAAQATAADLGVTEQARQDRDGDVFGPYFVQRVRQILEDSLGERLYDAPLRVYTTLDRQAQAAAEEELALQLERVEQGWWGRYRGARFGASLDPGAEETEYVQGAAVFMEAGTGEVLAWVGGRDFDHSRYDRVRLARRQAGSSFKPFVYAAALERGLVASQVVLDAPYRLARRGAPDWEPENYSGGYEGRMSMREALVRSQNIPAVRLAAATGEEAVADLVHRAGIQGEVPPSPVLALGVTVVSPLEMVVAYSAFANRGPRVAPRFIRRVEDPEGNLLWSSEPRAAAALDPGVAHIVTDILRDVVDRGTGTGVRREGYRGPAAGKTGTTSDNTDVWFVGFSPEVVGAVWVGFDDVRSLPFRATGGGVAAPVWGRIMARIRGGDRSDWPGPPPGVVAHTVDVETGQLLRDDCYAWAGQYRRELFLEGTEPPSTCPRRSRRSGRLSDWFDDLFGRRRPPPRLEGTPDPDLGVPRLPRRDGSRPGRGRQGSGSRTSTRTSARPSRTKSSRSAAARDRSRIRPSTNGPRSITSTSTTRSLARLVTRSRVPKG